MNYSYHILSSSELKPLSSFSVPLQLKAGLPIAAAPHNYEICHILNDPKLTKKKNKLS
ncbi:MAG: hypothetical protein KGQ16_01840 [Cyanobacteria bacterium REEB444]|nr:hypothetical protein [Cyanobacteria bacterium REEB444]